MSVKPWKKGTCKAGALFLLDKTIRRGGICVQTIGWNTLEKQRIRVFFVHQKIHWKSQKGC